MLAFIAFAIYGVLLAAAVVFLRAVARISHDCTEMSRSLAEIAAAMRKEERS